MIATTLYLHVNNILLIEDIASRSRITRKKVIVTLLMMIMKDFYDHREIFTTVKYQRDDVKKNWRRFHIRLRWDENEFFADLRKLCKCSVSNLLAIAVRKYSGELYNRESGDVDNYPHYRHYVLHHEVVQGVMSWRFYWGFPEKELKKLRMRGKYIRRRN